MCESLKSNETENKIRVHEISTAVHEITTAVDDIYTAVHELSTAVHDIYIIHGSKQNIQFST